MANWGTPGGTEPIEADQTAAGDAEEGVTLRRGAAFGHFVVLDRLGAGGMGVVFSAFDPDLERKVAIKVLRRSTDSAQVRLLREAQALARLSHPNVITVYEVGTAEDRVFVAMEYVDGGTLTDWLEEERRPWREVVARFVAAGRGLAAAHAAGIVHRDFKPDNVLLRNDGRVLVTDFGLARATASADGGGVQGTPLYMAPEQHQDGVVDEAADQFGFCVALYEGLYRSLPFDAETYAELVRQVVAGEMRPVPRGGGIPGWLGPIVARGLRPDPAARHPSMAALLAALEADPAVVRRRRAAYAGVGALATVAATAAVFAFTRSAGDEPGAMCRRSGAPMAAVWNEDARARISSAFAATGRANAADTATRVAAALDAKATDWTAMRIEACEATHVRGEQSPQLLDLRMRCLDRKRSRMSALIALLSGTPDREIVDHAVDATARLGDLTACADTDALTAAVLPPEDEQIRREVEVLDGRLDAVQVLFDAGKLRDALAAVTELVPQVEQLDYAPLRAEGLLLLASLQDRTGNAAEAEEVLYRAAQAAAQARDDETLARVLIELVWVLGSLQPKHAEAIAVGRLTEAVLTRAGDDGALAGKLHMNLGVVLATQGKIADSRAHHEQAYRLLEKALGRDSTQVATALNNLGGTAWQEGKIVEAQGFFERALEARERALGPEHVDVADSLVNVASVHAMQGHLARARPLFERARSIYEASLGPEDPRVATVLNNLGTIAFDEGAFDEARQLYTQVLAIDEKARGADHPDLARTLGNLGNTWRMLGDLEQARAHHERARAIYEKAFGPDHPAVALVFERLGVVADEEGKIAEARDHFTRSLELRRKALGSEHPDVATSLDNLAGLLRAEGKHAAALPLHREALAIHEKAAGEDSRQIVPSLLGVGEALLGTGRAADATAILERAVVILEDGEGEPSRLAEARFALARALWQSGEDRGRAGELAAAALAAYEAAGERGRARRDEIEGWQVRHRASE